jgi:hypothetical protein
MARLPAAGAATGAAPGSAAPGSGASAAAARAASAAASSAAASSRHSVAGRGRAMVSSRGFRERGAGLASGGRAELWSDLWVCGALGARRNAIAPPPARRRPAVCRGAAPRRAARRRTPPRRTPRRADWRGTSRPRALPGLRGSHRARRGGGRALRGAPGAPHPGRPPGFMMGAAAWGAPAPGARQRLAAAPRPLGAFPAERGTRLALEPGKGWGSAAGAPPARPRPRARRCAPASPHPPPRAPAPDPGAPLRGHRDARPDASGGSAGLARGPASPAPDFFPSDRGLGAGPFVPDAIPVRSKPSNVPIPPPAPPPARAPLSRETDPRARPRDTMGHAHHDPEVSDHAVQESCSGLLVQRPGGARAGRAAGARPVGDGAGASRHREPGAAARRARPRGAPRAAWRRPPAACARFRRFARPHATEPPRRARPRAAMRAPPLLPRPPAP